MLIYLIAWTGGYEAAQYAVMPTETDARALARSWAEDADEETDSIMVYEIDAAHCTIGNGSLVL